MRVGNGCSFWFWEGEYIDLLIERNLIDVRALLSTIKGNETAACALQLEGKQRLLISNQR